MGYIVDIDAEEEDRMKIVEALKDISDPAGAITKNERALKDYRAEAILLRLKLLLGKGSHPALIPWQESCKTTICKNQVQHRFNTFSEHNKTPETRMVDRFPGHKERARDGIRIWLRQKS